LPTESEQTDRDAIRGLIASAAQLLRDAEVESASLDAELIFAVAARRSRAEVLAGVATLDDSIRERFAALIKRRAAREPLAYLLGHKEFYSLEFEVGPEVLIPRPETEILVEAALEILSTHRGARVLDIGTGSGAIAIAIAANLPTVRVVATDVSPQVLEMADRNIRRFDLGERIELRHADCFTTQEESLGRFNLILSNPPYVPDEDICRLQPEVSRYEPRMALAGGPDGLDFYRVLARESREHLDGVGKIMVEVGSGQADEVAAIFRAEGFCESMVRRDLAGIPRVLCVS
jgi:release factor glutamine methyltransferase